MLSVARIDCIKKQREVEGLSISQIPPLVPFATNTVR
jgi:hypothetical protein